MKKWIFRKRLNVETGNDISSRPISYGMKKIITILIITIFIGAGIYWLTGGEQGEKAFKVSGSVVDLLTYDPVSGVDLTVNDTSIKTDESGQFVFTDVSVKEGIRLTHPELLRAIVKLPSTDSREQMTDILFDVSLYNTLITIIDREARGNIEAVYKYLAPEIKEKYSREVFREEYVSLFAEADITNQEIVLRSILRNSDYLNAKLDIRFSDIIEFEVINNREAKWYRFIYGEAEERPAWQLIY